MSYLSTHPYLTFYFDMKKVPPKIWMLLAEIQTRGEQLTGTPLLPSMAKIFRQLYLAKGVLATTAIEGNSLTRREVVQLLRGKLNLPPSREYLGQEVNNIVEVCNQITEKLLEGELSSLTPFDMMEYNRIALKDLPRNNEITPGKIREDSATVGIRQAPPPEDLHNLLERLCDWLNNDFITPPQHTKAFGILKAIVAHVYLIWIHPFGDGNGRTARIVEFQILLSCGLPATAAHLLSNHYNQTRSEYFRQLAATQRSKGELLPFIEYALEGFLDGLTEQSQLIRERQLQVHWINYVHEVFQGKEGNTDRRIKHLVLDLTRNAEPITRHNIRHVSPRMAEAYALYNEKTVQRDIKKLKDLNLLVETKEGLNVNCELMRAFIPANVPEDPKATSSKKDVG